MTPRLQVKQPEFPVCLAQVHQLTMEQRCFKLRRLPSNLSFQVLGFRRICNYVHACLCVCVSLCFLNWFKGEREISRLPPARPPPGIEAGVFPARNHGWCSTTEPLGWARACSFFYV